MLKKHFLANEVGEALEEILRYLHSMNTNPVKLSAGQLLTLTRLYLTLKSLGMKPDKEMIQYLFYAVGVEESRKHEKTEETKIRYQSSMRILRRLHGKYKTSIKDIISGSARSSDILDYIWLRSRNLLVRSRDKRLRIDQKIYSEELDEPVEREVSLNNIMKFLYEIPSQLWSRIITSEFLDKLSHTELVDLVAKYYGYNDKINRRMMSELLRRINSGADLDWEKISKDQRLMRKLTQKVGYLCPYSLEYMDQKLLSSSDINRILRDLYSLPLGERWKLLRRLARKAPENKIFHLLDPFTLSGLNSKSLRGVVKNRSILGKALSGIIQYMITGDTAVLDYSMYLLKKIDPESLDPRLRPVYSSLVKGDYKSMLAWISRNYPAEAIEFIGYKVHELFLSKGYIHREELSRALEIGYKVLRLSLSHTGEEIDRYVYSRIGRIDLRKTVYSFTRGIYDIVKRRRIRHKKIILLLDTSGSMVKHSVWAILSIARLIPLTKHVILFTDRVRIVRITKRSTRELILGFLEKTYIEGFTGYTNISLALRVARRIARRGDHVVLVSDLRQTVKDVDPVQEAQNLLDKGVKIAVIAPSSHDTSTRNRLNALGIQVIQGTQLDYQLIRRLLRLR